MRNLKNDEIYSDLPLVVSRRTLQEILDVSEKDDKKDGTDGEKRTVTRRAGGGRLSKLAQQVSGLAKNNPDALLQALGILEDKPSEDRKKTIAAIFNKIITSKLEGDTYFQYLFHSANVSGNNVTLKVIEYPCDDGASSVVAVSPKTCGSIVNSILYAMATAQRHQKIEWDENKGDKVEISYRSSEKSVVITVAS
jgi:hypothetical protein